MDAFFAKNRLSAYLDGHLSEEESQQIAAALERDAALRQEYESLREAVDLLAQEGPVEAPAGFHARVMASVEREPMPGGKVVWLRRMAARVPIEAVALAAAAAVVVMVIQARPDQASPEPVAATVGLPDSAPQGSQSRMPDTPAPTKTTQPVAAGAADPQAAKQAKPVQSQAPNAAPSEPYLAEWENPEGAAATAPADANQTVDLSQPIGYRISMAHADVLFDLAGLAQKMGGSMVEMSGQPAAARVLTTEQNFAMVQLIIPTRSVDQVHGMLRSMGGALVPAPAGAPMVGAGHQGFVIETSYQP